MQSEITTIADLFPYKDISCYSGSDSCKIGINHLVSSIERAEHHYANGGRGLSSIKLHILYRCYLEIVWDEEWSEAEKKQALQYYIDADAANAEYAIESTEFSEQLRTENTARLLGKKLSCQEIVSQITSGLHVQIRIDIDKKGQMIERPITYTLNDADLYLILQCMLYPELQRDEHKSISVCQRCGSKYIKEHGLQRFCKHCGSNAERQRASRQRKREAKKNATQKEG